MLEFEIWGGAGEYGRSCYYIRTENHAILFDCGGKKEDKGLYPKLDAEKVKNLDAVFLSHAHEDHCVALPLLYKLGFTGDIWLTKETANQLPSFFNAWYQYVESNGGTLPYSHENVQQMTYRYLDEPEEYHCWKELLPGISVCWGASGHMVGSVWFQVEMDEKRIFFTGDYCASPQVLKLDKPYSRGEAPFDLAFIDTAYGIANETQQILLNRLVTKVKEVIERGGHVLLPVPLYGRSQDLLVYLSEHLPQTPIAVEHDILQGLESFSQWGDWLQAGMIERVDHLFASERFISIQDENDRCKLIHQLDHPHVFFTTDSMIHSKKASWYVEQLMHDQRHAVIFTGHVFKNNKTDVLLAESVCEIQHIRYKIHQDEADVYHMLSQMKVKKAVLVHAPTDETKKAKQSLIQRGFPCVN